MLMDIIIKITLVARPTKIPTKMKNAQEYS